MSEISASINAAGQGRAPCRRGRPALSCEINNKLRLCLYFNVSLHASIFSKSLLCCVLYFSRLSIQSAGCLGQKEVVTAAHDACIRELLQEIDAHGKADRHMKLLTVETESRLGTLWDQEQCMQLCSKDELWEAAKAEEMKIPY